MAGSSLVASLLAAVGGLLIGRWVEPSTLGLFNGIGLVLPYAAFLGFGISTGLSRELPFFMGRGERPRAEELTAAAQAWALSVGTLVAVALVGVAGWELVQGDLWRAAGYFTNAIMALLLFYNDYLQVTYRTAREFERIALVRIVSQVALVALVVLVVPLDFYGLCLRVALAGILGVVLLYHWRPVRVGPRWNMRDLRHLIRIGLPIFVVWQIFTYWQVINQTLVLRLGGTHFMGLYSMVIMVMGAVNTLPGAVGQVLFPRMTEQYGRGQSLRDVARGTVKPISYAVVAVIPVILIAWWTVGPLTRWLIPQYAEAIPAMQWGLLICFVRAFEPAYALFNVGRRQGLRLIGILVGMAAYGGSLFWLVQDGIYLEAFPQAMLIGRSVYLLASAVLISRVLKSDKRPPG